MNNQKYKVDLLETQATGPQELVYSFIFQGGKISCTAAHTPSVMREGIYLPGSDSPILPSDGMRFMEALSVMFSGSMVRATKPSLF